MSDYALNESLTNKPKLMDETMQLVQYWSEYKKQAPLGSIEDFCQYHVTVTKKRSIGDRKNFQGLEPPPVDAFLIKLLGRIVQCYSVYATAALSQISELKQVEDFYFLNSITQLKEVRKTDVINMMLFEMSSGMDIINRLRDKGLLQEKISSTDKRSKLLEPTAKGESVLQECYRQLSIVNDMIWKDMSHQDKVLCIQLLKETEVIHSELATNLKGKNFDEMVSVILGDRQTKKENETPT
jgi:DNA-binding MarR family transcriptional regulator